MPGVGTPVPEKWTDSNGYLWLEQIKGDAGSDSVVYAYDHRQIYSENFSWQSLVDRGNTFAVDLLELSESEKVIED